MYKYRHPPDTRVTTLSLDMFSRVVLEHVDREKEAKRAQRAVLFGRLSHIGPDHPLYYAVSLVNKMHLQGLGSTAYDIVRRDMGLMYSAYSVFGHGRYAGFPGCDLFVALVEPSDVQAAANAIAGVFHQIQTAPKCSEAELQSLKVWYHGLVAELCDSREKVADYSAAWWRDHRHHYNEPKELLRHNLSRVDALTVDSFRDITVEIMNAGGNYDVTIVT